MSLHCGYARHDLRLLSPDLLFELFAVLRAWTGGAASVAVWHASQRPDLTDGRAAGADRRSVPHTVRLAGQHAAQA